MDFLWNVIEAKFFLCYLLLGVDQSMTQKVSYIL